MDDYWIGVLTIWAVCIVLIILVANIKNRSVLNWIGISLLISPVISLVVLIFMSKLSESTSENHHTYSGDANLANDSYKIYLTKKYNIEKNDALGKFTCNAKIFDDINLALLEADTLDGGRPQEVPIEIPAEIRKPSNIYHENPLNKKPLNKIQSKSHYNITAIVIALLIIGPSSYFLYQKYENGEFNLKNENANLLVKNEILKPDKSLTLGTWISEDTKLIINNEMFSNCKWLESQPPDSSKIKGCAVYFSGGTTSKKELLDDINSYQDELLKKIDSKEIELIANIKNEVLEFKKGLNKLSDGSFHQIVMIDEDELPSEDCHYHPYFFDKQYLMLIHDCRVAGQGISMTTFTKKNDEK